MNFHSVVCSSGVVVVCSSSSSSSRGRYVVERETGWDESRVRVSRPRKFCYRTQHQLNMILILSISLRTHFIARIIPKGTRLMDLT